MFDALFEHFFLIRYHKKCFLLRKKYQLFGKCIHNLDIMSIFYTFAPDFGSWARYRTVLPHRAATFSRFPHLRIYLFYSPTRTENVSSLLPKVWLTLGEGLEDKGTKSIEINKNMDE